MYDADVVKAVTLCGDRVENTVHCGSMMLEHSREDLKEGGSLCTARTFTFTR
jgi:hypothetical protein